MVKSFKYRIYPTPNQEILLNKHFGACRLIYNLALQTKIAAYSSLHKNLGRYDLQAQLTDLKKEYHWLREINAQSLQAVLMHLDAAYLRFFKGIATFPKFKKKNTTQTFQCPQAFKIKDSKLYIPKFREGIKMKIHRPLTGTIKNVTISRRSTNKYFASFVVDNYIPTPKKNKIKWNKSVGIDVGIKTFATLSDGTAIENPSYFIKSLKRIKTLQKRLSRKQKGSINSVKDKLKLSIKHEKIRNKRLNFLHQTSAAITKQYDAIIVEDLYITGMTKDGNLANYIYDAGWGTFISFLKYKCEINGKTFKKIGRFEPSSRLHNTCGFINNLLTLQDRNWYCPKCRIAVERDLNAAINIRNFGLKSLGVDRPVEPVELPTLVGTMKQEVILNNSSRY